MDQFLLEEILKLIPVKYYVINIKTRNIIKTNDEGLNKNGMFCHKQIFNKDLPCSLESGLCICESLLQTENNAEFITEIKQDSRKQFVKIKASKLAEDLVLATIVDITDEELLKKELKINNKRLGRAEKLADFGYWEFNMVDKTVLASEGARRIYGLQPGEELTIPEVQKYPLGKYRKKLDESLSDLILDNKPYNVKFEIKRKSDGEIRVVRSIAEYRKDKQMVYGVLHDITENNKAQKALIESEKNLQLLFENMNSAFAFHKIVLDEKGFPIDYIFLDVNNKFEELTGLNGKEIIGKTIKQVFSDIEDSWIEHYGKVALTGEPVKFIDYSAEIGKYFEVSAYSPKNEFFAVTFTDVTLKIESEKALDESLKSLKLAQQIAKLGNWQFDPDSNVTEWSEEINKILERDISLPAFTGGEYKSFFGDNNFRKFFEQLNKAVKKGVPFQFQCKANVTGNKTKWFEIICQPESEPGLKGYKLRGTIQDINDNKQIEVELNNSNNLLRTVIDNVPDAVYMKGADLRKVLANKIDAQRCNLEIADMIGKTDDEIYPREIAKSYAKDDKKVLETGMPIINHEEILPDGDKFRWILTSKIPLKNNENKVVGLVGIGRDITEIKENESKLRLLQQVIEQSPLSVVITNTNGDIEYVNPGFEKTTGYSREEAIGKNPRILNSGLQDENHYKNLWNTVLSGNTWHGEFHNKRKDGSLYWESAVIAPIFNENNEIKQFVAIKEDVTNIKQMVKDLEIAKEKAEESDRLKTVFLANMSHEIRTPLNGILGFANIICSGMCDDEQLGKYSKIIENSGQRLITVIDDIIDISMIQSNQLKIDLKEFDLSYLLEEIYIVYKDQKSAKLENIRFEMDTKLTNGSCNIVSDKNRIYQVLKNLLDNAFKFTEKGHIKFGCYDYNDSQVVLYVEDTGIGIEEDKINLVFEIFRQVEEGSSRRYEGSGLGLAITSGIVDRLGGKIIVQSEINKGTTFYVTLPHNTKPQLKINGKNNQSAEMKEKEIKFKRIVSFEDDKASSYYLKVVINLLGYELTNFEDAKEGIEYLRNNKVDLVLMDAQMPGMNGYEATQIIKSEMPDIPVIMQSAFAMECDTEKAIKAGCDDYLSKPVSMNNLKEKIEKYIVSPEKEMQK